MNTEIQFIHTKGSPAIRELVNSKLKLLKNKYEWITNAAVFLKEENHNDDRNKLCEIRLSVPGPQIFAKSLETTLEKSVLNTINDLSVQLEKHKSKMYA